MNADSAKMPLEGKRVVLTRAAGTQADRSIRHLQALGAIPVHIPTIAIGAVADARPLHDAINRNPDYLIVTSANAVAPLCAALRCRSQPSWKVYTVGPRTAEALSDSGINVHGVAAEHRAEGILEVLDEAKLAGKRVLIPTTAGARDVLPVALRAKGAAVDVVWVYETIFAPREDWQHGLSEWREHGADAIVFTSGSTVRHLVKLLNQATSSTERDDLLAAVVVCAIGPLTAAECQRLGIEVAVCPDRYTMEDLLSAIVNHFKPESVGAQMRNLTIH